MLHHAPRITTTFFVSYVIISSAHFLTITIISMFICLLIHYLSSHIRYKMSRVTRLSIDFFPRCGSLFYLIAPLLSHLQTLLCTQILRTQIPRTLFFYKIVKCYELGPNLSRVLTVEVMARIMVIYQVRPPT